MRFTEVDAAELRIKVFNDDLTQTIEDFLESGFAVAELDISAYKDANSARNCMYRAIKRNRHDGRVKLKSKRGKLYIINLFQAKRGGWQ